MIWIRSYWTCDWFTWSRTTYGPYRNPTNVGPPYNPIYHSAMLRSSHAHIVITFGPYSARAINPTAWNLPEGFTWSTRPSQGRWEEWNNHVMWNRFGFQYINSRKIWPTGPVAVRGVQFPYWSLTLLLAIAPLLKSIHYLRRRKHLDTHLCPTCGY